MARFWTMMVALLTAVSCKAQPLTPSELAWPNGTNGANYVIPVPSCNPWSQNSLFLFPEGEIGFTNTLLGGSDGLTIFYKDSDPITGTWEILPTGNYDGSFYYTNTFLRGPDQFQFHVGCGSGFSSNPSSVFVFGYCTNTCDDWECFSVVGGSIVGLTLPPTYPDNDIITSFTIQGVTNFTYVHVHNINDPLWTGPGIIGNTDRAIITIPQPGGEMCVNNIYSNHPPPPSFVCQSGSYTNSTNAIWSVYPDNVSSTTLTNFGTVFQLKHKDNPIGAQVTITFCNNTSSQRVYTATGRLTIPSPVWAGLSFQGNNLSPGGSWGPGFAGPLDFAISGQFVIVPAHSVRDVKWTVYSVNTTATLTITNKYP